jgi:Mg2+ and Co2+ transporter CorA
MLSKYEIEHIVLAEQYTKTRKLLALKLIDADSTSDKSLISQIKKEILDGETEIVAMKNFEKEESTHWAELYGRRAAADLLTIGKVQPETMLAMSALPVEDFVKSIKIATIAAKKMNDITIEAEEQLNNNLIPEEMI